MLVPMLRFGGYATAGPSSNRWICTALRRIAADRRVTSKLSSKTRPPERLECPAAATKTCRINGQMQWHPAVNRSLWRIWDAFGKSKFLMMRCYAVGGGLSHMKTSRNNAFASYRTSFACYLCARFGSVGWAEPLKLASSAQLFSNWLPKLRSVRRHNKP